GPSVIESIGQLSFDYAVLGTPGFHPSFGFAYTTQMIASITNKAIERAQKTILLMDSSKVNYIHTPRTLLMQDIDIVVSDGNLPQEIVDIMTSNGITVL
ncbi:MAG: DeoR/GlpR transcriptional regulator, partial [Lachnospiraceae bacterium]|nr:DeoR/GlpR transcriptional regulator [Lachnospiraceae bacterium]